MLIGFSVVLASASAWAEDPVKLIFDTDMDSDCDDAGALAMLHALADRGEVEILATMVSSKHPWSALCVDAINTFFRRPDLPIGAPKGAGAIEQGSRFARQIAEQFPYDLGAGDAVPNATPIYRRILATQSNHSVVIVTVGDLTNLRYLLESGPDKHSPQEGRDLVKQKVKHWVCMGSRYPADRDPRKWGNFKPDAASTSKAINHWPTLITFTGGGDFARSLSTGERLRELPAGNPVRRVYELYFNGQAKHRHSADQIAVMVAVRGTDHPWALVKQGHNHIFPDGTHEWREQPDNPRHQYISALAAGVNANQVAGQMEALMLHKDLQE